jgi:outer membrane protein TolC
MRTESLPAPHTPIFRLTGTFVTSLILATVATAQPPAPLAIASSFTREEAVRQALHSNPTLMAARKQHGYAEAALVIAKTYPYNPVYTGYETYATGPNSDNHVYLEQYISLEVELRGQGKHRRAIGAAAASRIDWEISQQEIAVSVAVIRAFNTVLYRQQKLAFVDENLKLSEQAFEGTRKQAEAGKVTKLDLSLARADLDSARAQRGQTRTTLAIARSDLRKLLGTLDDTFIAAGNLDVTLPSTDPDALTKLALDHRADLQAKRAALGEAEAAVRLVRANRFGNPSFGMFYEYDPTKVVYSGLRLSMPLAIFNTKKGEILKAETDVMKVNAEMLNLELQAAQDVQAALARLTDASKWAEGYAVEVLPNLAGARAELEALAAKNPAEGARLTSVKRGYLKASESWLDARFEVSQAEADLALAVAEPSLAFGPPAGLKK